MNKQEYCEPNFNKSGCLKCHELNAINCPNICEYWLMQDLMYDFKYIVKRTWWRSLFRRFGYYSLRVATIKAGSDKFARKLFISGGFKL